jgi:hypothetical protein
VSTQIIPLTSDPNQTFNTSLNIDNSNITLTLTLKYNEMSGYWKMSIANTAGTLLLDSIPVITGLYPAANLLGQYSYLNIGSAYVVKTTSTTLDFPDSSTLGTDFVLAWSDTQ